MEFDSGDENEPSFEFPKPEEGEETNQQSKPEGDLEAEGQPDEPFQFPPKSHEIDNLINLSYRSGSIPQCNLKNKIVKSEGSQFFSGVNIFSAFKSKDDYMMVEYGRGYALFVDGKLKKAEGDRCHYIDLIYSPLGCYCTLDTSAFHLTLFDDRGEEPPKKIYVGATWSNTNTPNLLLFPQNVKKILVRLKSRRFSVVDLEKEELLFQGEHTDELISTVCSGKDFVVFLKEVKNKDSKYGFELEVNRLTKNVLKPVDFFVLKRKKETRERPLFLTLGPREKHLLVTTSSGSRYKSGWVHIMRLSSKRKLTYLTCVKLSASRIFGSFQFHGYMRTKMVFSGVVKKSHSRIFTVVYDFKTKKVALVRIIQTTMRTVRRMAALGSTLHGVDDHCKKFELRV